MPVEKSTPTFFRASGQVIGVEVVVRQDLSIGLHGEIAICPVYFPADALDVGVGEDVVGVRAALDLDTFSLGFVGSGNRWWLLGHCNYDFFHLA